MAHRVIPNHTARPTLFGKEYIITVGGADVGSVWRDEDSHLWAVTFYATHDGEEDEDVDNFNSDVEATEYLVSRAGVI